MHGLAMRQNNSDHAPSNGDTLRTERFDELQRFYDDGSLTLHDLFHLVLDLCEEVAKLQNKRNA